MYRHWMGVLRGELSVGLPALRARLAPASQQALNAVEHVAQWLSHNAAAACRFAAAPVDLLVDMLDDINCEDSARLIE
jgi:hypothetical protein